MKNGQPLRSSCSTATRARRPWLTIYQEDLRKVGIGLNLRLVTPETLFKLVMERKFEMVVHRRGAACCSRIRRRRSARRWPTSEQQQHHRLQGQASRRAAGRLRPEFDQQKRAAIIQEIDGIVATRTSTSSVGRAVPAASRTGTSSAIRRAISRASATTRDMPSLWWIDPQKDAELQQARWAIRR